MLYHRSQQKDIFCKQLEPATDICFIGKYVIFTRQHNLQHYPKLKRCQVKEVTGKIILHFYVDIIRYAQNQKIGKPNNLNIFGSK